MQIEPPHKLYIQKMQTNYVDRKPERHADKVYWWEKCSRNMQTEHAEKCYRQNKQEKTCTQNMQTNYAERKDKETCSQDKQAKRADRTSGQIMQTEHAQTFSNFCDIYSEPSQVYLFCNS